MQPTIPTIEIQGTTHPSFLAPAEGCEPIQLQQLDLNTIFSIYSNKPIQCLGTATLLLVYMLEQTR